jgi:hypothetical protein
LVGNGLVVEQLDKGVGHNVTDTDYIWFVSHSHPLLILLMPLVYHSLAS